MNIDAVGIDSVPNTYKQIMWIKSGTLSGLGTDAWVFNYPVSIGNTATVQNNSRLTVGAGFTVYEGYIDTKDIRAVNINSVGVITASVFKGDGSQLQGVTAGLNLRQAGTAVAGGAATTVNFASGATISNVTSGIATITIAAGIQTEAATPNNTTTFLDLSKQDHKLTVSGITTISCTGGTEGESHTVRIVNSGISTVGFSTAFLFPSGSPPSLPTTSGAISIVSFTVHRVGTAGTQLLAGASLNFS